MHKQTWVKVNAPVGEGVAELILALSSFPKLRTFESCQEDNEHPAVVFFSYADSNVDDDISWRELSEFTLGFLGPRLAHHLGDRVTLSLTITCWGWPQGELIVRPGAILKTVLAIKRIRTEFKD